MQKQTLIKHRDKPIFLFHYSQTSSIAGVQNFQLRNYVYHKREDILPKNIKFNRDMGFSNSQNVAKWLINAETNKALTGLRKIDDITYYGDLIVDNKKSLLIFIFMNNGLDLVVNIYSDHYPKIERERQTLSEKTKALISTILASKK